MNENGNVERAPNPKENSNLISQLTFSYTAKLFTNGFKKDLEDDDLYEVVKSCDSKKCADKLEYTYYGMSNKRKPSALRLLAKCYGLQYCILGIVNLTYVLLKSTLEPLAIAQMVGYFKPGQTNLQMNDAIYYGAMLIGLKVVYSLYYPNYLMYMMQLSIQMRTSFSSLIYRKALKLSPKALQKTSVGNIVTVITKDIEQFENFIPLTNEMWIGCVQIVYIGYLIYAKIGFTSTIGVLMVLCAIPLQIYISKIVKDMRIKMNKKTDIRLQETQEALSTIKTIKMYTWELFFADRISMSRNKEVKTLFKKSITKLLLFISSDLLGKIAFYLIVILYIYFSVTVNAETIFYVMKCFTSLRMQIGVMFTHSFTVMADLFASLTRIEHILGLEELTEYIDMPDKDPQINVQDACVSFNNNDILKNITFNFKAGLNIVTGQLGSGKSSLIKLILRDYPTNLGKLHIRGRMSYASQDPWLFPGTIKQNILFGEKYNYERYNKVIAACALKFDLKILEQGDETIVKDRGINLSKGQQARINLARAIYKDVDIYLLDDVLSALDTRVQDHIFKECIEGILKYKLIVLITNIPKYIARSENLIVMEQGCIKYFGNKQNVCEELLQVLEEEKIVRAKEDRELNEKTNTLIVPPLVPPKRHIYHEDKKEGGVSLKVYNTYFKYGGGIFVLLIIIALYFIAAFAESSAQVKLSDWVTYKSEFSAMSEKHFGNTTFDINEMKSFHFPTNSSNFALTSNEFSTEMPSNYNNITLINNIGAPINISIEEGNKTVDILSQLGELGSKASQSLNWYSILTLIAIIIEMIKQYCVFRYGRNASINLHKQMIKSVICAKMSFFDKFFVGNILNRFSQDLNVIDEKIPMVMHLFIISVFGCIGIIGMMTNVSWTFLAPCIVLLILLVLMRYFYMPTARSLKRLEAATRSPIIGHLDSSLTGLTTVRACKAQEILKHEYDRHQDLYTSARYTMICATSAFTFYMTCLSVLIHCYVISRFLFIDSGTPVGGVGLTLTMIGSLTKMLQLGLVHWTDVENSMTSVERVKEFTKVESENEDGSKISNWPTNGNIEYNDVCLKYTNSNENVLANINLKVKAKEKIGIIGRTGAGKSTLIATLFRLYENEGTILIDGIDIKTISLKHLRQRISVIPQDPIIFSGTIRTNFDPLKEFTDEEIWKVVHKVYLNNKISDLETDIEKTNFSSGERQLLALGRAILRKNKIVVLDEATANMDPETEQLVEKAIDENFFDCTVLIVAHRLNYILKCNKVMILNRGEIMEYDDPTALLKNSDSILRQMIKNVKETSH